MLIKFQSLGLCTATVMFVLSQDRLNMDLDRDSLELMLNLLESDASHTQALEDCGLTDSQLTKTRDKVRQICADIQAQGHAKHLNLDNITVCGPHLHKFLNLVAPEYQNLEIGLQLEFRRFATKILGLGIGCRFLMFLKDGIEFRPISIHKVCGSKGTEPRLCSMVLFKRVTDNPLN